MEPVMRIGPAVRGEPTGLRRKGWIRKWSGKRRKHRRGSTGWSRTDARGRISAFHSVPRVSSPSSLSPSLEIHRVYSEFLVSSTEPLLENVPAEIAVASLALCWQDHPSALLCSLLSLWHSVTSIPLLCETSLPCDDRSVLFSILSEFHLVSFGCVPCTLRHQSMGAARAMVFEHLLPSRHVLFLAVSPVPCVVTTSLLLGILLQLRYLWRRSALQCAVLKYRTIWNNMPSMEVIVLLACSIHILFYPLARNPSIWMSFFFS